jgi:hypothetical protein
MTIDKIETQNSRKSNRKICKFDRKISKFGKEKEPSHVERLQSADDFARWPDFGQEFAGQTNPSGNSTTLCLPLYAKPFFDLQLYSKAFLAVGNIDMEVEPLEIALYFPLIYIIYLLSPFISLSISSLSI